MVICMAKKKGVSLTVDMNAYTFKQIAFKTGYELSQLQNPEIRNDVESYVKRQVDNYNKNFGVFNSLWHQKVVGILRSKGESGLKWALYRAFMNEYIKKVMALGRNTTATMTEEEVKAKFERLGANPEVLDAVINAIKSGSREMGLIE